MTEPQGDPAKLWEAVDALTRPTRRRVDREFESAEWLQSLADDPTITVCDVAAYRAATAKYGQIPSLWEQAEAAVGTGSEMTEGGGRTPLRERSPADLDLMETMLTIRESMSGQLTGRGLTPRASIPGQMRQLAARIVGHEPQHIEWWTFRFAQWARVLTTHLRAAERAPQPRRLRNTPCPLCKTRQVTIEHRGEKTVVPPIVIDFIEGWIRAATCSACGAAWWRGDQLGELADAIESAEDTRAAEVASTA